MRGGIVVMVLLFGCIRTCFLTRVKKRGDESTQHPACSYAQRRECSCSTLYNELEGECSRIVKQSERDARMATENATDRSGHMDYQRLQVTQKVAGVNCERLVKNLWNNTDPPENDSTFNAAFEIFLSPARLAENVLISFWAGFSHSVGTRQTLDNVLKNISSKTFYKGKPYSIHDIEHETHGVGRVLRRLNWDRHCHQSKHDADLWKALSRNYAAGAQEKASNARSHVSLFRRWTYASSVAREKFAGIVATHNFVNQVYILYNYAPGKPLEETFLFKHELELLTPYKQVKLLDFKNGCSQTLVNKIARRMRKDLQAVSCYFPEQSLEEFHDEQEREILRAMREGSEDIEKLEADYAQGIRWQTIRRNSPERASTKEESAAACRQRCISYRDCSHFNYDSDDTCEILSREDQLEYIRDSHVISGMKPRL